MRKRLTGAMLLGLVAGTTAQAHAFIFTPTFINGFGADAWTPAEEAVATQAMTDWTNALSFGGANDQNVRIQWKLSHAGTDPAAGAYLAQWTYLTTGGPIAAPYSSNITQQVFLNLDLLSSDYIGLTPPTTGSGYDLLSIFRHELGHAMGFYPLLYTTAGADNWSSHISNGTFDPAGLNVPMYVDSAHVNLPNDLMYYSITPDVRKDISPTDLRMLALADGYAILPAPEPAGLTLLALGSLALLRRPRRAHAAIA